MPDDHATAKLMRGLVAGVVAGAIASFAMDRFQAAATALSSSDEEEEPATEQAADAIATRATGSDVPAADKPLAGQAIHYLLGIGMGAAYGIAAEFYPSVTAGHGSAFGFTTATTLDQGAVPAVGLGEPPWKSNAGTIAYSYASHLVFAGVAEAVRRQVRSTLVA